jgi:hypothetical protein
MSKKNRTTWYVCGRCGNENVSYQVWVDENVRLLPNYYANTKTNGDDIDWQVAYAMNGQAWCEEDEELGTDGCGEIFGVVHKQSDRWWDLNYDRQMKLKESRNA